MSIVQAGTQKTDSRSPILPHFPLRIGAVADKPLLHLAVAFRTNWRFHVSSFPPYYTDIIPMRNEIANGITIRTLILLNNIRKLSYDGYTN